LNETQDYKGQVIATKTNGETKKVLVDDYGKIITSDGGTDGTSITQPTGGTGIRGWLSGIYNTLVTTGVKVLSIPALTAGTNIIGKVGIDPANNSVQLSGSNPENITEQLAASFKKDENGLGLLRFFLESVLDSEKDSVSLGGDIARSLVRQPINQPYVTKIYAEVLAGTDVNYVDVTLFDVCKHIIVQSLQIVTSGNISSIVVERYNTDGTLGPISLCTSESYMSGAIDLQGTGITQIKTYTHPLLKATEISAETFIWEFTNRDGIPIEFPFGLRIRAINKPTTATAYKVTSVIMCLEMPQI